MNADRRYRAVLFDVGDTLIQAAESFGQTYSDIFRSFDVDLPAERLNEGLRHAGREVEAQLPTGACRYRQFPGGERAFWSDFAQRALNHVGDGSLPSDLIDRSIDALRDHFKQADAWHVFEDTRPTLDGLAARGVPAAVVSNWDSRLPAILELLDLASSFQTVVVSALVGVEKPDPSIFHTALQGLEVAPEDCLHIGDRADMDGEGAAGAGIDARIIDREGRADTGRFQRLESLETILDWV